MVFRFVSVLSFLFMAELCLASCDGLLTSHSPVNQLRSSIRAGSVLELGGEQVLIVGGGPSCGIPQFWFWRKVLPEGRLSRSKECGVIAPGESQFVERAEMRVDLSRAVLDEHPVSLRDNFRQGIIYRIDGRFVFLSEIETVKMEAESVPGHTIFESILHIHPITEQGRLGPLESIEVGEKQIFSVRRAPITVFFD